MSSKVDEVLRRLKPEKRTQHLTRRDPASLPFLEKSSTLPRKLLYDSTVYIDILQGRFPTEADLALRAPEAWHSTVTGSELIALNGVLDPAHPDSAKVTERLNAVIKKRPQHRTIAPDDEIWLEAGVLAGILSRIQNIPKDQRRKLLNDALLFATARKVGLTLLTRNVKDFDLMQQLQPSVSVLFYSQI